jgi:outer membrane biosynthesis protein TonB
MIGNRLPNRIPAILLTAFICVLLIIPVTVQAADDSNGNMVTADTLTVKVGYAGLLPEELKVYTIAQLEALGTTDQMYTWITRVKRPVYHAVRGVKLKDIILDAGVDIGSVARIHFTCSDEHETEELTIGYLFNTEKYYYPNLVKTWDFEEGVAGPGATDGAIAVDTVLATMDYWQKPLGPDDPPVTFDEMIPDKRLRLAYGMTDVVTPTSPNSAQNIHSIELVLAGAPPEEEAPKEEVKDDTGTETEKDQPQDIDAEKPDDRDKDKLIGSEKGSKPDKDKKDKEEDKKYEEKTDEEKKDAEAKVESVKDDPATDEDKDNDEDEEINSDTDMTEGETATPPASSAKYSLLTIDNTGSESEDINGYQPWRTSNMADNAVPYRQSGMDGRTAGATAGTVAGLLLIGAAIKFTFIRFGI